MVVDTNGVGTIVMSNNGNSDDGVVKVEVKNVGTVTDDATLDTDIWLDDGSGTLQPAGVVTSNSFQQKIGFDLSNDPLFLAPTSGQVVTATITMASGATITQTISVVS
jgi:hypothetical protein